jgi:hypothetical protein
LAAAAMSWVGMATASADINNPAINGVFTATQNGEWARTNDSYHTEAVVRETWTIRSSCINPNNCTGTVSSDQGWTAELVRVPAIWKIVRYLPGWEACEDGTSATGRQLITFYPMGLDPTLPIDPDSNTYAGESVTLGPSGACGFNNAQEVITPFKLVKIG